MEFVSGQLFWITDCALIAYLSTKSRPLHISHTSVILNLPNFAKNSLNTFDWTKLDYICVCETFKREAFEHNYACVKKHPR